MRVSMDKNEEDERLPSNNSSKMYMLYMLQSNCSKFPSFSYMAIETLTLHRYAIVLDKHHQKYKNTSIKQSTQLNLDGHLLLL